ncbi:MAG: oxidoreductase domain protein [Planctomycetaceae bacterium]|nr:oxidoreductase domain protein [Planctomycetaceae bacterium]
MLHSRRSFLKSSAALAAASTLPHWYLEETADAAQAAQGAAADKDRPGIALIGCGGRGMGVANEAANFGRVVAVCDVDQDRVTGAKKKWPEAEGYQDFRKVLERKDVGVIVCGTVDHWHTLVSLAAMRSGKDIYCEKPLTLTVEEGQHLVKAAKQTGRILQTGSQQRSDKNFRLACELVRNGRIGKLKHVGVFLPQGRKEGPFVTSTPAPTFDWNLWKGPTPDVDYVKEKTHLTFRYWWDYSGGTMTDWGAHHNDIALWGIGLERSGPVSIEAKSNAKMIPNGFTAFDEYAIEYAYANGVTHSCHSTPANAWNGGVIDPKGQQHGVKFEGTDGWIWVTRGKIEASQPEFLTTPLGADATRLYVSDNHMGNFFDCVKSRKPAICEAEIGHRSASVCHLGVIALRLGRKLKWDPDTEKFAGDDEANRWLSREMRKPWSYDTV